MITSSCPKTSTDAFVAHAKRLVSERYPDLNGPDYTTIIDQPAFDRLVATLEDAKARGATVINLAPDQQLDARRRKLAPHIVLGVNDEMTIMKEEIFGPFLPIKTYRQARRGHRLRQRLTIARSPSIRSPTTSASPSGTSPRSSPAASA